MVSGLTRANVADLDGDGLSDLWGEVDGELRAFRGEPPEAWRALGRFYSFGVPYDRLDPFEKLNVDFDGDGITDTLIGRVQAKGATAGEITGSRTAAPGGSGQGNRAHVIWKAVSTTLRHQVRARPRRSFRLACLRVA